MFTRRTIAALLIASAACLEPLATEARTKPRRLDLADVVAGDYDGNVTSDMEGPPKNGVAITLTRVGVDRVRITSDYPRILPTSVRLTRAGGRIISAGGDVSVAYDAGQSPPRLELSFGGEVSWDGKKQ